MAEERNVGLARATDTSLTETARRVDDTDEGEATKEGLQRRMEEARESITQTVSEIKDTVTNQYQNVRESINDALDWREQVRNRPVAFSVGALGVGLLVGYSVRGMLGGGRGEGIPEGFEEYDYDDDGEISYSRSYAGQALTGGMASGTRRDSYNAPAPMSAPSQQYAAPKTTASSMTHEEPEEDKGPSLIERFKGTQAFDRLTEEVSTLGGRFVDELSHTAQSVVLPALLNKLKDAVGIDLSTQKRQAERSRIEREASSAHAEAVESGAKQQEAHEQSRQ